MGMAVGASKGPRSDINITPLMEKEIAVRVPEEPDQTQPVEPPPADLLQILFKVDEAGVFHVNNETLTDENAVDRLKVWYRAAKSKEATQGPPVIFFDADDKAKYVRAVKALDTIRDSSAMWTIGMMTESIKEQQAAPAPGAAPADGSAPPAGTAPPPAQQPTPEQPKQ